MTEKDDDSLRIDSRHENYSRLHSSFILKLIYRRHCVPFTGKPGNDFSDGVINLPIRKDFFYVKIKFSHRLALKVDANFSNSANAVE